MEFRSAPIHDVIWKSLKKFPDPRGWLCELFRQDDVPLEYFPVMGYVSVTEPGVARGPHEHVYQSDYFCFIGPSNFKMYLWDARPDSPTYGHRETKIVGTDAPMMVIVPPGVIHAYRNVGEVQGTVLNFANRLYRGAGRAQTVDEIRHEDVENSPFQLD